MDSLGKKILDIVKVKFIPEIVILYGSFSRNEGTFDIDEKGKKIPYNDIDLIFIDKRIKNKDIKEFTNLLKNELGTEFIDISVFKKNELLNLRKSIFSYDLFESGNVLSGNINLRKLRFPKNEIPLKEIEILFRTRIWTLVGSIKYYKKKINVDDSKFFYYQLCKCIYSIIDCKSVQHGNYESNYKEKAIIGADFLKSDLDLIKLAHDVKLKSLNTQYNFNHEDLYNRVAHLFLKSFEEGLQLFFNSNQPICKLIEQNYGYSLKAFAKRKLYYLKKINGDQIFDLILSQFHLVNYFCGKSKINKKNLQIISKKLKVSPFSVESLRDKTAKLRLE